MSPALKAQMSEELEHLGTTMKLELRTEEAAGKQRFNFRQFYCPAQLAVLPTPRADTDFACLPQIRWQVRGQLVAFLRNLPTATQLSRVVRFASLRSWRVDRFNQLAAFRTAQHPTLRAKKMKRPPTKEAISSMALVAFESDFQRFCMTRRYRERIESNG
jgi:hypothetical protein